MPYSNEFGEALERLVEEAEWHTVTNADAQDAQGTCTFLPRKLTRIDGGLCVIAIYSDQTGDSAEQILTEAEIAAMIETGEFGQASAGMLYATLSAMQTIEKRENPFHPQIKTKLGPDLIEERNMLIDSYNRQYGVDHAPGL